ncbi:uncharacterized protein SCHCODRAFT_02620508 [Schizophyllum commune H4-8]|uniref:uncharacterized protein n=1 Tax=Schizophyllum commune (strain H4-8 / FGSC 9210) TaxID=578458 RepID=UPI00215EE8B9|nr:uncharacterized protein SCHCODRAFT_02620508 [Schizophyllum commune H4-8]KAI5895888.1 hypothetical protein SCHCODRAFT_02620508 [Schizophyllum commune H4-8]
MAVRGSSMACDAALQWSFLALGCVNNSQVFVMVLWPCEVMPHDSSSPLSSPYHDFAEPCSHLSHSFWPLNSSRNH